MFFVTCSWVKPWELWFQEKNRKIQSVGHHLGRVWCPGFWRPSVLPALRVAPALPEASSIPVGRVLFPVRPGKRSAYGWMTPSPFTCFSPLTWFSSGEHHSSRAPHTLRSAGHDSVSAWCAGRSCCFPHLTCDCVIRGRMAYLMGDPLLYVSVKSRFLLICSPALCWRCC